MYIQSLNGIWTMKRYGEEEKYEAKVPTTMYEVLLENKVIEDPFIGENDMKYTELSDYDYIFERDFIVDKELLKKEHKKLRCFGLDTLCDIYINHKKLASTCNMFRTYEFSVEDFINDGKNNIIIHFHSPTKYFEEMQFKKPLWGVEGTIPGYEYLRKSHTQSGWDWGPQLPDMGIWRDIEIIGFNNTRVREFLIRQDHTRIKDKIVGLEFQIELEGDPKIFDTKLEILSKDRKNIYSGVISKDAIDKGAKGKLYNIMTEKIDNNKDEYYLLKCNFDVENAELWWPNNMGSQPLYTVKVSTLEDGNIEDTMTKKIGLRTITIHREADKYGESFNYRVNGVDIFAMGANYIPEDSLFTRMNKERTYKLLKSCKDANYNCIRSWGGGIYNADYFYDICDELGLIVWQDFLFACGIYPMDKKYRDNVRQEIIDNVKRLRHHASLGMWCGNNEMEMFIAESKDDNLSNLGIKKDYLDLYERMIPDIVSELDPDRYYWPASPSSGGGFVKPNDDSKGDVHYWGVFHGNQHFKEFRNHLYRFASEYGMQAFPDMKTIRYFGNEKDMNVCSPVMDNHNKCIAPYNGNVKIISNMIQEYKMPDTFEDTVYISQIFQGETIKGAVEHFRRNRGICMGSIYWQVNDNNPCISWSSIDYFGRWKAMHYFAKRFYAPVLISAYEDGLTGYIYVTNDTLDTFKGHVEWKLIHQDKGILESGMEEITVPKLSKKKVCTKSIDKYVKKHNVSYCRYTPFRGMDGEERKIYLAYNLIDDRTGNLIKSEAMIYTPHKYFDFRKASINITIHKENDKTYISIVSDTLVKSVGITFKSLDVRLSDNYFDLMPKVERIVYVEEGEMDIEKLKKDIKIMSIN